MKKSTRFALGNFDPKTCGLNEPPEPKVAYRTLQAICDNNKIPYDRRPGQLSREKLCTVIRNYIHELEHVVVKQEEAIPPKIEKKTDKLVNSMVERLQRLEENEIIPKLTQLQDENQRLHREHNNLLRLYQESQLQKSQLESHHQSLQSVQASNDATIQFLNRKIVELEQEYDQRSRKSQKEIEKFSKQVAELTNQLIHSYESKHTTIEKLKQELSQSQSETRQYSSDLQECRVKAQNLRRELDNALNHQQGVEYENASLHIELDKITKDVSSYKSNIGLLEYNARVNKTEINRLTDEIAHLQQQLTQSPSVPSAGEQKRNVNFLYRVQSILFGSSTEEKYDSSNSATFSIEGMRTILERIRQLHDDRKQLLDQQDHLNMSLSNMRQQLADSASNTERLQSQFNQQLSKNEQNENKIQDMDFGFDSLTNLYNQAKQSLYQVKQDLDAQIVENNRLTVNLENEQRLFRKMSQQLDVMRQEHHQQEVELESLRIQGRITQEEIKQSQSDVDSQQQALEAEIQEFQIDYEQAVKKLEEENAFLKTVHEYGFGTLQKKHELLITTHNEYVQKHEQELKNNQSQIVELTQQLNQQREQVAKLKHDLVEMENVSRKHIETINELTNKTTHQFEAYESTIRALRRQIELKSNDQELVQRYNQVVKERDAFESQVKQFPELYRGVISDVQTRETFRQKVKTVQNKRDTLERRIQYISSYWLNNNQRNENEYTVSEFKNDVCHFLYLDKYPSSPTEWGQITQHDWMYQNIQADHREIARLAQLIVFPEEGDVFLPNSPAYQVYRFGFQAEEAEVIKFTRRIRQLDMVIDILDIRANSKNDSFEKLVTHNAQLEEEKRILSGTNEELEQKLQQLTKDMQETNQRIATLQQEERELQRQLFVERQKGNNSQNLASKINQTQDELQQIQQLQQSQIRELSIRQHHKSKIPVLRKDFFNSSSNHPAFLTPS